MADENIVLVGYMGAGKTTVGKALAKRTGKRFVDTDALIVSQMDLSINDIFEKYGEAYFRDLETKLLDNLIKSDVGCIVSCGGGLPMREENRPYLKRLGKVVYLKVSETDIMKRLKGDTTRPLLKGPRDEVKERIHNMLEMRDPVYTEVADVVIKSGKYKVPEVVDMIINSLGEEA